MIAALVVLGMAGAFVLGWFLRGNAAQVQIAAADTVAFVSASSNKFVLDAAARDRDLGLEAKKLEASLDALRLAVLEQRSSFERAGISVGRPISGRVDDAQWGEKDEADAVRRVPPVSMDKAEEFLS